MVEPKQSACVAHVTRAWSAAVTTESPRRALALQLTPGLRDMLIASFFFALMGVLVKEVEARLPVQHAIFARSLIGLFLSWLLLRRHGLHWKGNRTGLLALRGFFGFVALVCNFGSLSLMPLSDATVLHQTQPIWTTVLAAWFLAEATSRRIWLATAVALTGVVLVARPDFLFGGSTHSVHWAGPVLALFAALGSAFAYVSVRALRNSDHPIVVVFWFALVATPFSLPAVIANPVVPTGHEVLLLIAIGITVQIAQLFMTRALHREAASRVTAIGYSQVAFAFLFGALFFGESLTLLSTAGALLVIAGAMLVTLKVSAVRATASPERPPR